MLETVHRVDTFENNTVQETPVSNWDVEKTAQATNVVNNNGNNQSLSDYESTTMTTELTESDYDTDDYPSIHRGDNAARITVNTVENTTSRVSNTVDYDYIIPARGDGVVPSSSTMHSIITMDSKEMAEMEILHEMVPKEISSFE